MRHLAAGLVIKNGKLLLERRSTLVSAYPGALLCPGGAVGEGESTAKAIERELTSRGIDAYRLSSLFSIDDHDPASSWEFRHHFYLVSAFGGDHKGGVWMTHDQLRKERLIPLMDKLVRRLRELGFF